MTTMQPKRRLYLVILAAMFLALFVQVSHAEKIELTMRGNTRHLDAMQPLIDSFNESQDRISVTVVPGGEGVEAMTAAYLADQLPDLIESAGVFTNAYAPQGWMASLEPFIAREGSGFLQDFFPATLDSQNRVNGALYSLPIFLQIQGMYYNPEILDGAGISPPQAGWTWADLRANAQKARRFGPERQVEIWGLAAQHPLTFDNVLTGQAGGAFIDDDYNLVIDDGPVRETYEWILSGVKEEIFHYIFAPGGPNNEGRAHKTAYIAEATYRQDTWDKLESPNRTAPPLRMDASSQPTTIFSDRSIAIMNVAPERQEAAWEFVKFLLRADNLARYNASLGYPPATRSAAQHPIYQEYAQQHPNILVWAEQYGPLKHTPMWPQAINAEVQAKFIPAAMSLDKLEITLSQFMEDLKDQLTAIIKAHKEGK